VPQQVDRTAGMRPVQVQILLAGGHRHALELAADSPVLQELVDAMAARLAPPPHRVVLFQVPLEGGRAALSFTSDQLVALTTTPPVLAGSEDVVVAAEPRTVVRARYLRLRSVLGPSEKARLLDGAVALAPELVPSRVAGDVPHYRRSRLVSRPDELVAGLVAYVREHLPEFCARLDVAPFPVGRIEAQLTVHNDGDYYRVHTDSGTAETAARQISYVYYFHREPKRFSGGELVLFDAQVDGRGVTPLGPPIVVEPADDSLVVFPSACLHEVRPVQMLSDDLADGRFTVNGWVRRAEGEGAATG
jgi:hypothetical protein